MARLACSRAANDQFQAQILQEGDHITRTPISTQLDQDAIQPPPQGESKTRDGPDGTGGVHVTAPSHSIAGAPGCAVPTCHGPRDGRAVPAALALAVGTRRR
ncbi:hypothetical protein SEVIR_1G192850v4 [Setaria viridis]